MTANQLQQQLFQSIKLRLQPGTTLADEIAAVLQVSTDSAYRRIKGEKSVSFDELHTLCTAYHVSIDTLFQLQTDVIPFQGKFIDPASFRFAAYLAAVGQQVQYMGSFKDNAMYYLCKDIPLFHHYHFKELAAFKYFFWHKTLLQSPDFINKKISLTEYPDEIFEAGCKALRSYNQLRSYEIWNMESLNGTLRQVEYYHDTGAFKDKNELLRVYESLEKLFTHLELQAELGYKFDAADEARKPMGAFQMYYNEVVIGDNSILAVLDGAKVSYITHTGINFMITRNPAFCDNMYNYYQNLMQKSTLISTVSERERGKFFKLLRKRIAARKANLEVHV